MANFNDTRFANRISNDSSPESTNGTKYMDFLTSDIERQKAHILKMNGYARPTRFAFIIEGVLWGLNERLNRNCQTISLPGRSLMSQAAKIYGSPRDQVYEVNYPNELQITFRVGDDMLERDFFERWMNTAMSHHTHDVNYPEDYMTTMKIYQLDRADNYVYCSELYNVFAKSIGDIELSTDSSDQIETINITLGYSESQIVGYTKGKETPEVPATSVQSPRRPIYPGSRPQVMAQLNEQYFGNKVLDRTTEEATQQTSNMFDWLNR
jgi:hypothetical protein